jgi:hypothetical protein
MPNQVHAFSLGRIWSDSRYHFDLSAPTKVNTWTQVIQTRVIVAYR